MNPLEIQRPQDIHISDQTARITYYLSAEAGDYATMHSTIYNIDGTPKEELKGKVITEEFYNGFIDYLLQAEGYFQEGVLDTLANHLLDNQTKIDNIDQKGAYSGATQYEINNLCIYNNLLYFVKAKPPVGTLPSNTTYFVQLGLRGAQGRTSMGVVYKGAWNSTTTYSAKNMVEYNGSFYVAKASNTNKVPSSNPTSWELSVLLKPVIKDFSSNQPDFGDIGSLWLQIQS